MSTVMDRLLDEDWTRPPEGTVRALAREKGVMLDQAWALYGCSPVVTRSVPFSAVEVGQRFRFNALLWERIAPSPLTHYFRGRFIHRTGGQTPNAFSDGGGLAFIGPDRIVQLIETAA